MRAVRTGLRQRGASQPVFSTHPLLKDRLHHLPDEPANRLRVKF
ncbi:MAG: hypothetical protein DUW69_000710 [Verrucomicrobia bacterium]|nr:MAG: hypothetical protein DUW69_000710 [Verrucomicrobiota bacterium]